MQYLLDAVNAFFETDFGPGDLAGAYAGVRPLISTADPKKSVDISRKAELYETSSGHDHDHGRQAHDLAAHGEDDRGPHRRARVPRRPCRTHEIPLGHPVDPESCPRRRGSTRGRASTGRPLRPVRGAVLGICAEDPSLAQPIVEGMPDLLAEAVVAARYEQARSVADVLLRRTRLGLLAGRRLIEDPEAAAGWPRRWGGAGMGPARDEGRGGRMGGGGRSRSGS